MTNSHSSNRHYREEFEAKRRFRLNRAFLVVILIIAAVVTHYLAFLGGAYLKGRECRTALNLAVSMRPACPAPIANGLTQWTCAEHEFKEHMSTCAKRSYRVPSWYRYIKPSKE